MKERVLFAAVSAAVLFLALCLRKDSGAAREETVVIAAASDLHYIAPELTDHGTYFQQVIENADGKAMEYCEELTEAFVEQVIGQAPDLLVISGDLTFNGARASHEALAAKLARIEAAGIPVLVLPGNHDLENYMAASFHGDSYTLEESVTGEEFAEIYGDFGYREAVARDSASLSYVAGAGEKLWILMLDVNTVRSPGTLTDDTLAWAERQLRDAERQGIRVLAVSHQNVLGHNHLFPFGFVMGNHEKLLELYEKYSVICSLSGHMHVQHIEESEEGFLEIASSCLAEWPNQYGVLTLDYASSEGREGDAASESGYAADGMTAEGESEEKRGSVPGSGYADEMTAESEFGEKRGSLLGNGYADEVTAESESGEKRGFVPGNGYADEMTAESESGEKRGSVLGNGYAGGGGTVRYRTVSVDVSAANRESSNPDLRNFSGYAYHFLWETAYRQAGSEMGDDEKGRELKRFFADVNTAYIAGRMDSAPWDEELYQTWKKEAAFLYAYLQSIADDGFRNYTECAFVF